MAKASAEREARSKKQTPQPAGKFRFLFSSQPLARVIYGAGNKTALL
jgi:hypothetical protein